MESGNDEHALVLRVPTRHPVRGTAVAALALALGGMAGGIYVLFGGQILVGLVIVAWSAYLVPGWWRALRRPAGGREVLRMDALGVTVRHGRGRGEAVAWSVAWPQVRTLTVREVQVPVQLADHLGPVTKLLTIDVLDHQEVEGPADHRERLLGWALLAGTTTSRARLQIALAEVDQDAVRRIAAWLAENRPAVGLDIDVTGPEASTRQRVPSGVAVLATAKTLRTELEERLRAMGLRTQPADVDDADTLTERLRSCALVVAVDADPELLSDAAARAGVDRVLLAVTGVADPAPLVRSDRAWTVLDLTQGAEAKPALAVDDRIIVEGLAGLLANRDSVRQVWLIGPGGVPVAATGPA